MTAKTTVGVVGLGHMGGAMATRLLAAGYPIVGTDPAGVDESFVTNGLQWRDNAADVAEAAEIVLTSIPNDAVLDEVASSPTGILAGLRAGSIWVDLSTVSPKASRSVAARVASIGAFFLDSPVSGSVPQVETGTLTIMVGGDEAAYRRVEPVLRELGTPTHIGDNGQGLALKLAINISLGVQMLAFAEGFVLAERSGVDRELALKVMTQSPIGSPMLKTRAPLVLDLPQDAWFGLRLMQKDLRLALELGNELHVPLATAQRADEAIERASGLGYGDRDLAAFVPVLEQLSADASKAAAS